MPTPADSPGANPGPAGNPASSGDYIGHGARLDALLTELMRRTPELEAAAVVTADGLPMSSALPPGMDEDRVAAMSAALLSLGERAAEGLGRGGLSQVHIQGESGGVWLLAAGDDAVLVGVSGPEAKAGLVLYELRRATAAVGTALAADELAEFAERASRAALSPPPAPAAPAAPVSSLPTTRPSGIAAEPATIVSSAPNGTAATAWPASGSAGWS
ncbi:MAG TPA: roadblock/LC7 domain-containing protein [Frankiaceae bacterium]|nr:roadblock/LC7 domain-containing protein [Frankiaceae bacterium]